MNRLLPNVSILIVACLFVLLSGPFATAKDNTGSFPKIDGKFSSKTESQDVAGKTIDYGGKLRLHFIEGKLHRRRERDIHYDYFFEGTAELIVIDTSALDNLWIRKFGKSSRVAFPSAYLCGKAIPQLLDTNPEGWREDKISRRVHHGLQFNLSAAEKYFGVDLPGELMTWSDKDVVPPPIWVDIDLANDEQLVIFVTPEIEEQLNVFVYDELSSQPYLVGAFSLNHFLLSQPIDIDSTIISINLLESGRFEAQATLVFPPGTDCRGLNLTLPNLYKVDSVIDASGRHLDFIKKHFKTSLYIAPRQRAEGASDFITVYYRGKFIAARYAGYDFPANLTGWFPHVLHRNLGSFTINYTYHDDLTLNSVGTQIAEVDSGGLKTTSYRSDADISYISFALGKYDIFADTVDGTPISFYVERQNTIGLFNRSTPKTILSDLSGAFDTYYHWFGPPIVSEIKAVDRMHFAGQSSPGLIHLPTPIIFDLDEEAHLCSHEIAHQWWGHTAVPKTYREMWLSEGLAEYTSYLYMSRVKKDERKCRELLATWRRHVIETGNIGGLYSRGYKAGPITLGGRLYQSYSPGDYIALIYAKAAYMLRMLHFEIDGPDYRTDFFLNMLNEYCRTFHGSGASSLDFMRIAATKIGSDRANQFFSQWLFDWRVPAYECRYAITRDDKERPRLEFTIEVSDVDSSFSTPFPVEIEFDDGTRQQYRVDGVGQQKQFILGPFPHEIKNICFDPDDILLCTDKKVIAL